MLEIKINMDEPCRACGEKGATQNGLCIKCTGNAMERKLTMATKGKASKGIPVPEFQCPGCGKTISGIVLKRVVDAPATPAEAHYEIEGPIRAAKGDGLFDEKDGGK